MKVAKYALGTLLAVLVLSVAGFVIWASTPLGPEQEALTAIESDSLVDVNQDHWLTFEPAMGDVDTGFIFYPGGRVDYRSYAPLARRIASEGYLVIIVPMPLNLAVFSPGRAEEVIEAYPEIERWVIGGHSLGGAMAANYVYTNPSATQGLILWASYPATSNNLTEFDIPCASIYGSLDGQIDEIRESHTLLPEHTQWVEIEGGNHAQFGWYGPQSGDNPPQIGHIEQEDAILAATLEFLNSLTSGN
jgi:hypothetical protein